MDEVPLTLAWGLRRGSSTRDGYACDYRGTSPIRNHHMYLGIGLPEGRTGCVFFHGRGDRVNMFAGATEASVGLLFRATMMKATPVPLQK